MNDFKKMSIEIAGKIPITFFYALIILFSSLLLGALLLMVTARRKNIFVLLIQVLLSMIRGNPLVVLLFLCYYSLPTLFTEQLRTVGIVWDRSKISPVLVLIIAFSIYYATYQKETLHSAIRSVGADQKELAQSLGYTKFQLYWRVILPQASYYAFPTVINNFLKIITSLALGFTISIIDIFAQAKLSASINSEYLLAFSIAAVFYWLISLAIDYLVKQVERRKKY